MNKQEWFLKKEYSRGGLLIAMFLSGYIGATFGYAFGALILVVSFIAAFIIDNYF